MTRLALLNWALLYRGVAVAMMCSVSPAWGQVPTGLRTEVTATPVLSQQVLVTQDVRPQFFDILEKFAQTYGFSIELRPTRPGGAHFIAEMARKDVLIVALNSTDARMFRLYYYDNLTTQRGDVSASTIEALAAHLAAMLPPNMSLQRTGKKPPAAELQRWASALS